MPDKEKANKGLPPIHRMLRKIGIDVPRPEDAPFLLNVLLFGVPFGVIWGAFVALSNQFTSALAPISLPFVLLGGLMFGVFMAVMSRSKAD